MTTSINNLIAKAQKMARSDDNKGAMELANELVEQYPNEIRVWSLRAYLHALDHRYAEAIADRTRAIEINGPDGAKSDLETGALTTVDLFFNRGADRFALGDDPSAVDDFTKGLELCDYYNSDDYRETLYFWRAESLLRLRKKREALSDLAHVSDDFRFWTYKLRTKADLLADCNELPG